MEDLHKEYTLSLYGSLANLKNSQKSAVYLVQNQINGKIYIKKELKTYKIDVYKAMQEIKHKNTPKIYEVIELNNTLYIIEEFINGNTLEEVLKEQGPLDEAKAIKYILEVCNILELLHNRELPIIHRDIKPSNIIISNDEVVKLIDFDVSRTYKEERREDTHILGTKGYASPEQFGFEQTDCRSDIYSLGIMINVLTTGEYPKDKLNEGKLKAVILKCTQIAAEKRYLNIEELRNELEAIININGSESEKTIKPLSSIKENGQPIEIKNKDIQHNNYNKAKKLYDNAIKIDVRKYTSAEWLIKLIRKIPGYRSDNFIVSFIKQLPGFRSKNLLKIILALHGYFGLLIGFTSSFDNFSIGLLLENTTMVLMFLAMIFINTNYKDIRSKLIMLRSKDYMTSRLGIIIYNVVIFFIAGGLLSLFESI